MPGLFSDVLGSTLKTFTGDKLGNKKSVLKGDKSSGTVSDMVDSQETANEILKGISDKIDSLGGDGGSIFGGSGSKDGGSGDGILGEVVGKAAGEAASKGMGNSKFFAEFSSKISSMSGSMEGMSGSMKGMSGSMSGGMIALQVINKVLEAIRGVLGAINDTVQKGIDQSIANQKQYLGPISSRLQSFEAKTTLDYNKLTYDVRNIFTNSRYINQQRLLENLSRVVETGVGYNIEDRAYLMTIADRTVKTFDVLDANLSRMIRLQQTDLTRPQMGMEAYLTKGLNALFQDTSYLNGMYDSVTSALMDATSQMSYDQTTSYLYNVQKWLGSLYSVGISENAISTIARGLNLLGSGNVSQLTGDDQLNTLFAMSAQRAGLSYAQLLTTGVSDDNVDKLLRSMIEYLQSIAENTSSEVLRNEYGRIFGGFSVSDLRAIQNLTPTDIGYIDAYKLDYEGAHKELNSQIKEVVNRTSLAEQVENMFNNLINSIGGQVAENEELYKNWVYSGIVEQLGSVFGDVIPGVFGEILENGTAVVTELIKTTQVLRAIHGDEDAGIRGLTMFKDYEFDELADKIEDESTKQYEEAKESGNLWELQGAAWGRSAAGYMEGQKYVKAIEKGVANWDVYSQIGALDPIAWYGDKWQEFARGDRVKNYVSNMTVAENAFEESENKIKAASEEITGVDDTVAKSLDTMYDSLFGESAKPIKVMIVDIDGNLLGSTTTNQFTSNFDVEENIGAQIFNMMPSISSIE